MAREQEFEASKTFDTVSSSDGDRLSFRGMAASDELVRGSDAGIEVTVEAHVQNNFYVTFHIGGEKVQDVGDIPMSAGSQLPITADVPVPDAETMEVIVRGGVE